MILTAGNLSSLVGAIYDCVIQPQHWSTVLENLRAVTHCANAVLAANLLSSGEVLISSVVGISPEWQGRMNDYSEHVMDLWGGVERIAAYPLEEPIVCSQAVGMARIQRNLFYRDWARPQGLCDSMVLPLERE